MISRKIFNIYSLCFYFFLFLLILFYHLFFFLNSSASSYKSYILLSVGKFDVHLTKRGIQCMLSMFFYQSIFVSFFIGFWRPLHNFTLNYCIISIMWTTQHKQAKTQTSSIKLSQWLSTQHKHISRHHGCNFRARIRSNSMSVYFCDNLVGSSFNRCLDHFNPLFHSQVMWIWNECVCVLSGIFLAVDMNGSLAIYRLYPLLFAHSWC